MFLYLVLIILVLIYYTITRKYNYFAKKKVSHVKPTFLLGNFGDFLLQKKTLAEVEQDICKQFPDEPFIGAYYATEPVLIPIDPEIIKHIVTKDFYYFNGRELSEHNDKEAVSLNLFGTYGDKWKVIRQNMTPLFSSAKMKKMFHLIQNCSYVYETMIDREVATSKELEVRSLTSKYTVECITACGFGVEARTMGPDPKNSPFFELTLTATSPPASLFYRRAIRTVWPTIFYGLGFQVLEKQIDSFRNMVTSVMRTRNYKHSGRNDFLDLVMGWKESNQIVGDSMKSLKTGEAHKVTLTADDDLLVAQCFVFFTAGFETSSTTLSYTLYELAKHPEIQDKVLAEVDAYLERHDNKLVYECISELPYLEACTDETMRLYPVLGVIPREQMEDYTFPNGVKIEKGMRVHLPVYYLHHNPKHFPNPEEFRPERFYGDEKKNIIPYTYMPFGEGPRTCIGMRFARMQMMAGLITILKKYRLELAAGTPTTLKFKPYSLITQPEGGITLKFIEREGWESRAFVKE
ncbi:cytochrome P450 6B2-like [Anticarsia gemmatalis]|uniref:cytochrome P450 6B2-like n=1 Tax=Anticarsia gemmatalis TaxID=129554 RepID=UPI003F7768D1